MSPLAFGCTRLDRTLCALLSLCSSLFKGFGACINNPASVVMNAFNPTSIPTMVCSVFASLPLSMLFQFVTKLATMIVMI